MFFWRVGGRFRDCGRCNVSVLGYRGIAASADLGHWVSRLRQLQL